MDVFEIRNHLVADYERFSRSFTKIRAADIQRNVQDAYAAGRYWPSSLIQLNPRFVAGSSVEQLVDESLLPFLVAGFVRVWYWRVSIDGVVHASSVERNAADSSHAMHMMYNAVPQLGRRNKRP